MGRTGLDAQFGIKAESTYGTQPGPVDRFYEFVAPEKLKMDQKRVVSKAIRAGARTARSDRWALGRKDVGGSMTFELASKSMGLLFNQCFGQVSLSGVVDAAVTQTHTPGDLAGKSVTGQVGRPDLAGTINPFTYEGLKVASFEVSGQVDEIGELKIDWIGEDETTATALAVASYPSAVSLLSYTQGTLTVGGAAVNVRGFSLKGDNQMPARPYMGSAITKEPLEAALRQFDGTIDADFESLAQYNRYVNGTEAALVLLFQGALIGAASRFEVRLTANVRFDGETPTVEDPGVLKQPSPYVCLNSGAGDASAVTLAYKSSDTAI